MRSLQIGGVSTASATTIAGRTSLASKLRDRLEQAKINNPRIQPVLASLPTVTLTDTTPPSGLTNIYRVTTTPLVFRETGYIGAPYLHASLANRYPAATPGAGATNIGDGVHNGTLWRAACVVDSIKFAVLHGGYTTKYRYIIDGQYIDATGYTPSSSTSSTACWDIIDFTSAGGRKERLLVVEGAAAMSFGGVYVAPTETVRHPGGKPLSMLVIGTSLVTAVGATQPIDGFAAVLADFLGIEDFTANGVAGSGYVTKPGGFYTFAERIADMNTRTYDLIVVEGGFNDVNAGQTTTAVQAAVTSFFQLLRSYHPNTPIVNVGVWPGKTGPSASWIAMENAIAAGVTATADPLLAFVKVSTDPAGAWITGTGKVGATTGTGNADVYISADGIHPPTSGYLYYGRRVASAVVAAVGAM